MHLQLHHRVPAAHRALLHALKYLPLVVLALAAGYELLHGHFVLLAIAAVAVLAFLHRLDGPAGHLPRSEAGLRVDGGSFSADNRPPQSAASARRVVLDGGSLERAHL